jgi:hypothetical protein
MYTLYYISSSVSTTSSITIIPDSYIYSSAQRSDNSQAPISVYQNATLQISASTFESSGPTYTTTVGTLRAYVISASVIQASFPFDQVNIFYNQQYPGFQIDISPTASDNRFSPIISVGYSFIADTGSAAPSSFSFKLNDSSSTGLIDTNNPYSLGALNLRTGSTYTAIMTGSGDFYNLSFGVYNLDNAVYDFSTSSIGAPLFCTFSINDNIYNRTLLASSSLLSGFSLLFDSPGDIPYGAGELDLWNAQFGITASSVVISGATASLFGGNLSTFNGSLSVGGLAVNNIIPYSLAITSCSFAYSTTTSSIMPNINLSSPSLSNLKYFDMTFMGIGLVFDTGSLPSPSGSNIETYKCSDLYNAIVRIDNINLSSASSLLYFEINADTSLTGGTPNLSTYNILSYFSSNNCALDGGIGSLDGCYNLREFSCYSNGLTGSIPSLSNLYNLTSFNVSDNNLSGSIPSLSNNTNLVTFYCNNNAGISGSIPNLSNNINLANFNCTQTKVIGPLPDLSNNTKLYLFSAASCKISGSIPSLSNNSSLYYLAIGNNHLTGSIPSLSNNQSLYYFNVASNRLSGSIPDLSNNRALSEFYVHNNYLTSYTSSGISPTLQYFSAHTNMLDQTSIDGILYDLDRAGGINGDVELYGGTNSAPSALGYTYTASLVSKGWTVTVN